MSRLVLITFCFLYLIISGAHAQAVYVVTNTNDNGVGSFRQAITDANQVSGAVVINFALPTPQTITLLTPLPSITKSGITITGPGAGLITIRGEFAPQAFSISNGVTSIAISGLTIANGNAVSASGGCIQNNGELSLTDCVISQCAAESGGGIYNTGTLLVDTCTFSYNTAMATGGAIYSVGLVTISRSTFYGNSAGSGDALNLGGTATITDSTFCYNGASAYGEAISSNGATSIQRCTITANNGTGVFAKIGGTTIANNIIYGHLDDRDLWGNATITDNGYNIIGTYLGFSPALTSIVGVDPLLGPLSNNGGSTLTCALGAGSPAINAANPSLTRTTDQRGFPQVGPRDIGAFEVQSGSGGGDPSFVGFMGQKFGFSGKPSKSFHIFSDPFISINSRFALANPAAGTGTVMCAFGIRWENHTITFGVDTLLANNGGNKDASLLISVDGIERTLPRSNQPTLFDNCINATWSFPKFSISTPLHKIVIDWRSEHNKHINGSYLNIRIDAPLDSPSLCGGIIGQTASAKDAKMLSKRDSDFITSDDMVSTEAKTSKFSAHPMLCAAMPTQPPSTAAALHEHDV